MQNIFIVWQKVHWGRAHILMNINYFNTLAKCESWIYKFEYKFQKPESRI